MNLSANSPWSPIPGGITAPKGFQASGISAGLKSNDKLDLALLTASEGTICAGSFTNSVIRASCVDLCIERLMTSNAQIRAVLINSGQANACTGDRGLLDSLKITRNLANRLNLKEQEVLICSTGVIGEPIPIDNLLAGLESLVQRLSDEGGDSAANAILTTDLVDKQIAMEARLGDRLVRIGGMAKGSGMIHPNMATMLAYITCDALVPADIWIPMIKRVVQGTFNAITVDGDTSTNDSFLAFSTGEALEPEFLEVLEDGLTLAAEYLAKAIVRDGEGANCLIEVQVEGSESDKEARTIARTICSSSLVKTAIHGKDPNWGRIVAAAGRAGVPWEPKKVSLWIGPYQLMAAGEPINFERQKVSSYINERMKGTYLVDDSVFIRLCIGNGSGIGSSWGCDFSKEYIRINSEYTT